MCIFEILFEVLLYPVRIIVYFIFELILYLLLGSVGASVRWLFFQIVGKPRKMKDLKTRRKRGMGVRKKKKKEQNPQYGYTTGDVFLGGATVFVVIVIIARFY